MKQREKTDKIFQDRMAKKTDELRWLYMELYGNDSLFFELCDQLHRFYEERSSTLWRSGAISSLRLCRSPKISPCMTGG